LRKAHRQSYGLSSILLLLLVLLVLQTQQPLLFVQLGRVAAMG
jgi:hypothetical protein